MYLRYRAMIRVIVCWIKKQLATLLRAAGLEISLRRTNPIFGKVVSIESPNPKHQGFVLISYSLAPFLVEDESQVTNKHTDDWECLQMANAFLKLGYSVDVISHLNMTFIPTKKYSYCICVNRNMERIAKLLNQDCVKILHVVWAHWLFHNRAEYTRLVALQQRKNVVLRPRRTLTPSFSIEYADCATVLGNKFTIDTYKYANKPIYNIPISATNLWPWPKHKNFNACRQRFLWFGSHGPVHKGLDLVLEAFSGLPNHHLMVCGPIGDDEEFVHVYRKELYETKNIQTIGWVDVGSNEFINIAEQCIAVISASCSEGGGGSVIQCMHAALIPIVSYENSVDIHNFGMLLEDSTVENIQKCVQAVSLMSATELESMARRAWQHVRDHHTREKFAENYELTLDSILKEVSPQCRGSQSTTAM